MNTSTDYENGSSSGTPPRWVITDRLKKARESIGLDQEPFADLIGIGRGSVSNYERGVTIPKRPVLLAWAIATGVTVEWLMTGEEPSET